jgi:hypothetical protein
MIAIAILAFGFGAISWVSEMRTRSYAYRQRAFQFEMLTGWGGSGIVLPDGRAVCIWVNEDDLLRHEWAWRMAAKYQRLSYYPWQAAEPDLPPPRRLAHPRNALEMPKPDDSVRASVQGSRPPGWTFLWTWHRRGSVPWE